MLGAVLSSVIEEGAWRAFGERDLPAFTVVRPRDPSHGDFACNLPLLLAGRLGLAPLAVAERLAAGCAPHDAIAALHAAAPGFLNLRLRDSWLADRLRALIAQGVTLSAAGAGRAVEATYVAPARAPLRPSDARRAIWGDVMVRLLEAVGHPVTVRHVLPAAWAGVGAPERAKALMRLTRDLAAVGLRVDDWGAPGDAAAPAGAWLLKIPGRSADHEGVEAAQVAVTPREAAASLEAVVGAIGADAFRWLAVSRALALPVAVDRVADTRETLDNPLFLIPYTHARLAGLERLARQEGLLEWPFEGVPAWEADERQQLLRLLTYPDVVAAAAAEAAPHRLTRHLAELVGGFHQLAAERRVFGQAPTVARARMALIAGTRLVLAHGLDDLLGITPLAAME